MKYTYRCPQCGHVVILDTPGDEVEMSHSFGNLHPDQPDGVKCENSKLLRVWQAPLDIKIGGKK